MNRLLSRVAAALLCLAVAFPAAAALDADAILVYGDSWRRVLPTYAAAARAPGKRSEAVADLPPVILWREGEERWTTELLRSLEPKKVVVIGPPGLTSIPLEIPGSVERIEADDASIDGILAARAFGPADRPPAVYVDDGVGIASALASAILAAADRSPLLVSDGDLAATVREAGNLARRIGAEQVVVVGRGDPAALATAAGRKLRVIDREQALAEYARRVQGSRHLVLTAPSDVSARFQPPRLSLAAIPYALAKGAPLAFVGRGAGGDRGPELAVAALEAEGAGPFDFVTIVGDYVSIPLPEIRDVDQVARGIARPRIHKLPAFNDPDGAPSDRAVGRLAALDLFDLSRWVVRLVHGEKMKQRLGALVLANADHKFVVGETISRTSSAELRNAGVKTESFYRDEIGHELIQRELAGHGLVLWEGHPRDLTVGDDALPLPETPLPPAVFFLQGCYTLDYADPYLLIERGANAVVGTYMAVYSSSGSAFAKAWLDAQLYGGQTMGQALATARNYLLATVELKKRRGHKDWRKTLRAALSFEYWGDPTAMLPVARQQKPKLEPVTARVKGNEVTVRVPARPLPKAEVAPWWARIRPNALVSGIYDEKPPEGGRRLIELFLVELEVPEEIGADPVIEADYAASTWAWVYAPRSRKIWLLVHEDALPAPGKPGSLRFRLVPRGETPTTGR